METAFWILIIAIVGCIAKVIWWFLDRIFDETREGTEEE